MKKMNMSIIQQDGDCQLKATHWSSMNDEETHIPQGKLQLSPKSHYWVVLRNSCSNRLQKHKDKLKVQTEQDTHRPEIPDKNARGLKYFDVIATVPFKELATMEK